MFLTYFTCQDKGTNAESLTLGEPLPRTAVQSDAGLFIHPGEIALPPQVYYVVVSGIHYDLVVDDRKGIKFIGTNDSSFTTDEGFRIGNSANAVGAGAKYPVRMWPGWGFFVHLPSGWNAAFVQGNGMTDGELLQETPVIFFQKHLCNS